MKVRILALALALVSPFAFGQLEDMPTIRSGAASLPASVTVTVKPGTKVLGVELQGAHPESCANEIRVEASPYGNPNTLKLQSDSRSQEAIDGMLAQIMSRISSSAQDEVVDAIDAITRTPRANCLSFGLAHGTFYTAVSAGTKKLTIVAPEGVVVKSVNQYK